MDQNIKNDLDSIMNPITIETPMPFICVYNISDLHADPESNKRWVVNNCKPISVDNTFNILIVPGDVASNIDRIRAVFNALVVQYDLVMFIPGNHEAWCSPTSSKDYDSLHKLGEVLDCAEECGVEIRPVKVISTHPAAGENIVIIPLYSWYHSGFDSEPLLTVPVDLRRPAAEEHSGYSMAENWSDFAFCRWPRELVSHEIVADITLNDETLAQYFAQFNAGFIAQYAKSWSELGRPPAVRSSVSPATVQLLPTNILEQRLLSDATIHPLTSKSTHTTAPPPSPAPCEPADFTIDRTSDFVITFSHFVPRQELTPEKRFLLEADLTKVIGSNVLEAQIRALAPRVHLFGHTHIPLDLELGGIRYVQWPLGYHREHTQQCREVFTAGPLLVHSSPPAGPYGAPVELATNMELCRLSKWSQYYKTEARDPSNMELAIWVRARLLALRESYERMKNF